MRIRLECVSHECPVVPDGGPSIPGFLDAGNGTFDLDPVGLMCSRTLDNGCERWDIVYLTDSDEEIRRESLDA